MTTRFRTLFSAAALLAFSVAAHADITMVKAPGNVPGDENVVFNDSNTTGPALMVQGVTNQTNFLVDYWGAGENLVAPSGGQARVEAADGQFTDLMIGLNEPGASFSSIVFNLNAVGNGSVNLTADQLVGSPHMETFSLDSSGQNYFIVTAANGQRMTKLTIDSTIGIADIRQVRIGGAASASAIPEPGSMALLATAALPLLGLRRRR